MAEHVVRMRSIDPSELLPEETVLQKDPDNPFSGPGDRREPYRTLYIAYARLQPVFQKEKFKPPLSLFKHHVGSGYYGGGGQTQ